LDLKKTILNYTMEISFKLCQNNFVFLLEEKIIT